jgi:hypothetical protein
MRFLAVMSPWTLRAQAPEAIETAKGIVTMAMYTGLLKMEKAGGIRLNTTVNVERKVTMIQLRLENGAISMRIRPSFFLEETPGAAIMAFQ